jgi:Bax protein
MNVTKKTENVLTGISSCPGEEGVSSCHPSAAPAEKQTGKIVLAGLLFSLVAFIWFYSQPSRQLKTELGISDGESATQLGQTPSSPSIPLRKVSSAGHLINELKKCNLWEIQPSKPIIPFLLASYPSDLETLSIKEKKRAFLHVLLPAALVANQEIKQERENLLAILDKIPAPPTALFFSAKNSSWKHFVNPEEITFIKMLTKKYRSKNAGELLERINIIPVSLILAQGAIESSWGTSRFSKEGNNLFGMWTWEKNGIVPVAREEGKNHKIEAYDSIFSSLKKYMLTLNRLGAYRKFRQIRTRSLDPLELAEGLMLYSERGEEYIQDIKRVIEGNRLTRYDSALFPDVLLTMATQRPPFRSDRSLAQL